MSAHSILLKFVQKIIIIEQSCFRAKTEFNLFYLNQVLKIFKLELPDFRVTFFVPNN